MLLGGGTVAGHQLETGEPIPGTAGENSSPILFEHSEQPVRVSVPGPQEPKNRDRVQPDTVHAPVFHHARVPRGRGPTLAQRDFSADTATVRRQRDNHRLGTRVWLAVHAGGSQHTDGRQSDGAPDKRDTSKQAEL